MPNENYLKNYSSVSSYLEEINSAFPDLNLQKSDIEYIHEGYLPAEGKNQVTNEPILKKEGCFLDINKFGGPVGLFRVEGTKLTSARLMACKVVNKLHKLKFISPKPSISHKTPLYTASISSSIMKNIFEEANKHKIEKKVINRLLSDYGDGVEKIFKILKKSSSLVEHIPGSKKILKAELFYVMEEEMAITVEDVVYRRIQFDHVNEEVKMYCASVLRKYWGDLHAINEVKNI